MTILFVGATSKVGRAAIPLLLQQGRAVRAFTRASDGSGFLPSRGLEVVRGDLRDAAAVRCACNGAAQVVASAHAATARARDGCKSLDLEANRTLVDAAREAGVQRFVYLSARPARPDHPVDFFRYKARLEEHVRSSGLDYTIFRPAAFMETWAEILGEALVRKGRVVLFGRGNNPINFISARDVARYVVAALEDNAFRNRSIDLAGPENLTLTEVVRLLEQACGRSASKIHVPVPLLRSLSVLVAPFSPLARRMLLAGAEMATEAAAFDAEKMPRIGSMVPTRFDAVARDHFAGNLLGVVQTAGDSKPTRGLLP